MVDTAVTVTITTADGVATVITGTTNHPFYVPAVHDFVAMGELNVGAVLQTAGGATAVVQSKVVRYGCFYVYNFEVAGEHNYYVAAPDGCGCWVLVHNNCGKMLSDGEIKALEKAGIKAEDLKSLNARYDLFKKPNGDIVIGPKGGAGPGDPTGINIKDIMRGYK